MLAQGVLFLDETQNTWSVIAIQSSLRKKTSNFFDLNEGACFCCLWLRLSFLTSLWSWIVTSGASFFSHLAEENEDEEEKKKKKRFSATPHMLQRFCWLQHLQHDESLSFAARRPCVPQLRWSCKMCDFASLCARLVSALADCQHVVSGSFAGTCA